MIRLTALAGITFALDNFEARPRLEKLIAWLRDEETRLAAKLAATPEPKPVLDGMGRSVATKESQARNAIVAELDAVRSDITSARSWLLECGIDQEWHVSAEISAWLNRPALAESADGVKA